MDSVDPLLVHQQGEQPRVWDDVRPWPKTGVSAPSSDEDHDLVEQLRQLVIMEFGCIKAATQGHTHNTILNRQVQQLSPNCLGYLFCVVACCFVLYSVCVWCDRLEDDKIESQVWKRQTSSPKGMAKNLGMWHADYYADKRNVISVIVYLGHEGDEPLVGGWTGFVDTPPPEPGMPEQPGLERLPNNTAVLREGLMVAPRVGRVVAFTGGGENYHSALPTVQGRRQSMNAWFMCKC